jgi:hypothetical protein
VLLSFAAKDHDQEGPCPGPDFLFLPYLKAIKSGKGDALRKEQAFFASFLWPPGQKGWRLAGRDPPVML